MSRTCNHSTGRSVAVAESHAFTLVELLVVIANSAILYDVRAWFEFQNHKTSANIAFTHGHGEFVNAKRLNPSEKL
ncbi:MAG: type II secretion system protein [Verrucomicrobia bacterium]|nr:type II secretion system protein [Verrucomicrobiota bacterium]